MAEIATNSLKALREARGLSQSQLAELSGVSVRMIQKYEQGERDIWKAQAITAYALAVALGASVEEIIQGETAFSIQKNIKK